jgi:hypothetical protein
LEVFYLSISHSIKVEEAKALKAFKALKALKDLFSSKALFDFFLILKNKKKVKFKNKSHKSMF